MSDLHARAIEYLPVTRERWPDMQRLFEASAKEDPGHPSRCWCMEMRLGEASDCDQVSDRDGESNRSSMEELVQSGQTPGILAYQGNEPIGWCSISPRAQLNLGDAYRSRPIGTSGVWSVACFYVPETRRGEGLMKGLLSAAVDYAISAGAEIVEGYPVNAEFESDGAAGIVPIFEEKGFVKAASVNPVQQVMCFVVQR